MPYGPLSPEERARLKDIRFKKINTSDISYLRKHHAEYPDDLLPNGRCRDFPKGDKRHDLQEYIEQSKVISDQAEIAYKRKHASSLVEAQSAGPGSEQYFGIASDGIKVGAHYELRKLAKNTQIACETQSADRKRMLDELDYPYHSRGSHNVHIYAVAIADRIAKQSENDAKWHGEFE